MGATIPVLPSKRRLRTWFGSQSSLLGLGFKFYKCLGMGQTHTAESGESDAFVCLVWIRKEAKPHVGIINGERKDY